MATTPKISSYNVDQCIEALGRIDADRGVVLHQFMVLIGDAPTYDVFEDTRARFVAWYGTKHPNANDGARNVAWSRFQASVQLYADESGYSFQWPAKPKATSPEAVKKAESRKVPEAVAQSETVAQLDAIAKPSDKIEAAKLEAAIAAKKLALIKAETKSVEQSANAALKARRDALIAVIRKADAVQLAELEAMAEHNAPVIMACLPLDAVQAALPKLMKLAASAPAKTQKGKKPVAA